MDNTFESCLGHFFRAGSYLFIKAFAKAEFYDSDFGVFS